MSKDYGFLKPGFRWIRLKIDKGGGGWLLAEFSGQSPFLRCDVVFNPHPEETREYRRWPTDNPDMWEYGPELNIPSDLYYEAVEKEHGS